MAEKRWNFKMTPPEDGTYTEKQVNEELAHANKAFSVCGSVAKALSECRRKPAGKIVHPEKCQKHAEALIDCYQAVKAVPQPCAESFHKAVICLDSKGHCETLMNDYIKCEHPISKIYGKYV